QADQAKKDQSAINSQQQATAVVSQYEQIYGPITPAQLTAASVETKIDFIVGVKLNAWAGKNAPLNLNAGTIHNLTGQLVDLPAPARSVIGPITTYLEANIAVLGLIDDASNASTELYNLNNNLTAPSLTNGGIQTSDGATHAGFVVVEPMAIIDKALANTSS